MSDTMREEFWANVDSLVASLVVHVDRPKVSRRPRYESVIYPLDAVESGIPVVPVRVIVEKGTVFDGAPLLSRGKAEVRFGRPIIFERGTDCMEATVALEDAAKAL